MATDIGLTFIVADTFFGDNGGQFTLAQAAPPPPAPAAPIPTLSEWTLVLMVIMLAIAAAIVWRRRPER